MILKATSLDETKNVWTNDELLGTLMLRGQDEEEDEPNG